MSVYSRSFNSQSSRDSRDRQPPKFDKGPQIDTWTNETAENAEKENATGELLTKSVYRKLIMYVRSML